MTAKGLNDPRVRKAWRKLDRTAFVPAQQAVAAGRDTPLPIGHGQTISQPSLVAYMTERAETHARARVLEIGTGSGYQAALLAELTLEVYTVETIPELAHAARERLHTLGYTNIYLRTGDGHDGWPEAAPFDIIMVTAAAEEIPPALGEQLAEGGRMLIPLGAPGGAQDLYLIRKTDNALHRQHLLPVRFVPFV